MDITGKVALITGAIGGLGGALTRVLLEKGAKVCLLDIDDKVGVEMQKSLAQEFGPDRVIYVHCDVTKKSDFEGAFTAASEQLGDVQIVCNNAGIVAEFSIDNMIDVNLKGVYLGMTEAIERMRKDKGGKGGVIVNIASNAGVFPLWMAPVYAGTKAGVIQYTRSWAMNPHISSMGIRLNTMCPGAMLTPLRGGLHNNSLDPQALAERTQKNGYVRLESVTQEFLRMVEEERHGDVTLVIRRDGETVVEQAYQ